MAAIAAILDFGPSLKSNGMILGPYLIPHQVSSKSVEFFRNTVHKQTDRVKTVTSVHLRWRRLITGEHVLGTPCPKRITLPDHFTGSDAAERHSK